jgi:hypothetical protein
LHVISTSQIPPPLPIVVADDDDYTPFHFFHLFPLKWIITTVVFLCALLLLTCLWICRMKRSAHSSSSSVIAYFCNYYCNDCQLYITTQYQQLVNQFEEGEEYDDDDLDDRMKKRGSINSPPHRDTTTTGSNGSVRRGNNSFSQGSTNRSFPDYQLSVHYRKQGQQSNYLIDSDEEEGGSENSSSRHSSSKNPLLRASGLLSPDDSPDVSQHSIEMTERR